MKRLYWLSVLLILLVAACSGPATEPLLESDPSAEEVVATEAASDGAIYANDEADFTITLPADWATVEPSTAAFAEIRGTDGQAESLSFLTDEYIQALLTSGLQLYALDEASASKNSNAPVSLYIIRRDAPESLTLDEYVTETAMQFENILDLTSDLELSTVMIGDVEAKQLRYTTQTQTAAGTQATVHNTQYYLMQDAQLYIITLEMGEDLVDEYLATAETAAETFQLTSGG